ncbi:MAG: NUDIX domain-containing protein [Nocardioides sp.]
MSQPRVAAGALFFDEQGQLLLVKPTYKEGWEIPGGYVEAGETPIEACEREVTEELGLTRKVERLLVVDWAPADNEGDKLLFVFDGGILIADELSAISLPPDELERFGLHPQSALKGLMIDRLAKRVATALDVRGRGDMAYLEHGTPTQPLSTDWWTTDDVASFLDVSPSTVRAYMAREQMPEPDRRMGRLPLWRPASIRRWHEQRPRKPAGPRASA